MTRDFHLKKVFTSLSFSLLPGQCTTPIKKVNSKSTKYLPSQLKYFPALNHHSSIYPSTPKNDTGVEKKGDRDSSPLNIAIPAPQSIHLPSTKRSYPTSRFAKHVPGEFIHNSGEKTSRTAGFQSLGCRISVTCSQDRPVDEVIFDNID